MGIRFCTKSVVRRCVKALFVDINLHCLPKYPDHSLNLTAVWARHFWRVYAPRRHGRRGLRQDRLHFGVGRGCRHVCVSFLPSAFFFVGLVHCQHGVVVFLCNLQGKGADEPETTRTGNDHDQQRQHDRLGVDDHHSTVGQNSLLVGILAERYRTCVVVRRLAIADNKQILRATRSMVAILGQRAHKNDSRIH